MQFIKRTAEINQTLSAINTPMDFLDPSKIQNPETQCFSVKYLTDFEVVLDKAMNDFSSDKAARNQAE